MVWLNVSPLGYRENTQNVKRGKPYYAISLPKLFLVALELLAITSGDPFCAVQNQRGDEEQDNYT